MVSPVNDNPAVAVVARRHIVEGPERTIPVPATEVIPKGRIIRDFARGSIFWEVERGGDAEAEEENNDDASSTGGEQEARSWGNPFNVEWIPTARLPFYRTRELRNPWNSNRFVKVARDGTELETTVGRKLIHLFYQTPRPVAPPVSRFPAPQSLC